MFIEHTFKCEEIPSGVLYNWMWRYFMMKNWTDRDWKWLVGILISVIILLVASIFAKNKNIELNFSIISSAVSIALALIAIFIAINQERDNKELSYKLNVTMTKIEENLKNVDNKVSNVDNSLRNLHEDPFFKIRNNKEGGNNV